MPYTIIRPGGLKNSEETNDAFLTEDKTTSGSISRINVATLVAKAIFSEKSDNKVMTTF